VSGKANKARRKQERLRQRRHHRQAGPAAAQACPLYRDPPGGIFYGSWLDCGSLGKTIAWSEVAMQDRRAAYPDVRDLARRMPYLASIYGRMVPVEAACQLDGYIDADSLPVQWEDDGPVTMMPAAQLVAGITDGSPAGTRVAIHDLHARGCLMIDDDGTVIPLVPGLPDLAGDGFYDPARYRLAHTARPAPRPRVLRSSGERARYGRGYPVTGITWSQQEFLALPWVQDYLPAGGPPGSEPDPRGHICGRYGEKIPADLAVIDMAADDTAVIAVANARRGYLDPGHLHAFTGLEDTRAALHHLHSQDLLLPLSNGLILAPALALQPLTEDAADRRINGAMGS
jgi:hypothetical protein